MQTVVLHLNRADVAIQVGAPVGRYFASPKQKRPAVQPVATQEPPPIRAHHNIYEVQDELCHDRTFKQLVEESKLRERELEKLETNLGFGFKPKNQRKPF